MKLVLMQPYFFPYIGYFMLIKHSDKFIIFDTAQFMKGGWVNRNRILKSSGDPMYFNALIHKAHVRTAINEIKLNYKEDWKSKILAQLEAYKKFAPYYYDVSDFLKRCFEYETDSLAELNYYTIKETCKYLNIEFNLEILSEMNINIDDVNESDEWGLNVTKAMNAKVYLNAPGGMEFYDKDKYAANGIDLRFIKPNLKPYDQKIKEFVPGLSIIDVMMFNSVEEINKMLDDYEVL
ncbi:MAG: WbqC family protein [Gudongella sp.]|nr:WbqC family protein [Gudongella sp.]